MRTRHPSRLYVQDLCAETRFGVEISHALDARRCVARASAMLWDDPEDEAIAESLARAAIALNEALILMEKR